MGRQEQSSIKQFGIAGRHPSAHRFLKLPDCSWHDRAPDGGDSSVVPGGATSGAGVTRGFLEPGVVVCDSSWWGGALVAKAMPALGFLGMVEL